MQCAFATISPSIAEATLEDIHALWDDIISVTINSELSSNQNTQDERYKKAFGDVTDADVAKLNEYLNNKVEMNEQTANSKEESLRALEYELSKRFKRRIS